MKTYKIYKITNEKNGKVYIGCTIQKLAQRLSQLNMMASQFTSDYRKQKGKDFKTEIIIETKDEFEARELEEAYIYKYRNNIYNRRMTSGYQVKIKPSQRNNPRYLTSKELLHRFESACVTREILFRKKEYKESFKWDSEIDKYYDELYKRLTGVR